MPFRFDNTYARDLEGFFVPYTPVVPPGPVLLRFNRALADELGLELTGPDGTPLDDDRLARIFSGAEVPAGAHPLAQAYAGHQFGGFVPQLGDGRAMLLGEVIDRGGRRRDIAFKGSGPTAFARGGDGKAAVGPVLREYVIGEAMHALGIPTTRALAAVATGEPVFRDRRLPGAVLTRVAASHMRVGTFQFFAVRGDLEKLRRLTDYAIDRHYPDLAAESTAGRPEQYLAFLRAVIARQAALIARWMHVGFIHGVMNTDNMAISGETIDYGPCAFMEAYSPDTVFSSIDHGGRYAYGNQPQIALWNLARLAETLLPLVDPEDPQRAIGPATEALNEYPALYDAAWLAGMRAKLGLSVAADGDVTLANDWLMLLDNHRVDFTRAFRRLADAAAGDETLLMRLFEKTDALQAWLDRWRSRLAQDNRPAAEIAQSMRQVNPLYIPRNERVEEALAAATERGDLEPFERLLEAVTNPFDERPGFERYAEPAAPQYTRCYRTFCGT
jgi:uncharacterized protein YdiU (UPF0061 family)